MARLLVPVDVEIHSSSFNTHSGVDVFYPLTLDLLQRTTKNRNLDKSIPGSQLLMSAPR